MVGHDHSGISYFVESAYYTEHIKNTFIRIHLLEAVSFTTDISKMNIEDFLPLAKVPDDIEYLVRWIVQVAGNCPDTKVESVIRAGDNFNESLQTFDISQHSLHSSVTAGWNAGVVRMASHLNLVFRCHGDHTFQKVTDSLPEKLRRVPSCSR